MRCSLLNWALTGSVSIKEIILDIDYGYIKEVLEEIKQGQSPYVQSGDLFKKHLNVDDSYSQKFVFHWHLIVENGFISTNTSSIYDLKESGLIPSPQNPMHFMINGKPIRLTTIGVEFLQSLNEPKVLEVIQDKFKNEGLSAVFDISKQLTMKILNKKLDSIDI
ncbi:DUF2513 domain-containing protein [Vibrio parahaemolyticus]|nr:DUF2513 domain-containing protein [Vibrio parahaemolyticus]MBE3696339.1 DUF2513 domain-containing protein [Vibrio parahaemolyticus]MCI9692355.1 DUF2513 domain-containing protein [Vibrio parahaemolyticus]HBC3593012.1 DUF2513 domain-containing protein [Vibrio parahaemolyticus]HBC3917503.1 DUF2513 domain-containing protein [Vibrio parahaemolyticus]